MDLKKHTFLIANLVAILVFIIIAFIFLTFWIESYTEHGEEVTVPDFVNLDVDAAQILAEKEGLVLKVSDTLIADKIAPGAIVDYFPSAGSKVKRGRTIYLSVNSMTAVMVKMPNVTNVSLRQAIQLLENRGLQLGNIEYKPDFANNYVLEQRYHSKIIEPGTQIAKGSAIDLLVCKGGDDVLVPIPALVGMSWSTISDSLVARGMSVNPIFDESVKTLTDSMNARVQKQSPAFVEDGKMNASGTIDLWLGLDPVYDAISNDLQ